MRSHRLASLGLAILLVSSALVAIVPATYAASSSVKVVQVGDSGFAYGSSGSFTFGSSVSKNDVIVVALSGDDITPTTVTDSLSTTYTKAVLEVTTYNGSSLIDFHANAAFFIGAVSASGSLTVNFAFNATGYYQVAGYDLSNAYLGGMQTASGSGAIVSSQTSMSTSSSVSYQAGSFLALAMYNPWGFDLPPFSVGSPFTVGPPPAMTSVGFGYGTPSSAGTTSFPSSVSVEQTYGTWVEVGIAVPPLPATSTSVSCLPSSFVQGTTTTCTATVSPTSSTGTVSFSSTSTGGSFPSGNTCTLSGGSCSVTYADANVGTPSVSGTYSGSTTEGSSTGTASVTVMTRSALTLTCSPSPVEGRAATACTAEVSGTSPTGTVTFNSTSGTGTFPSGTSCTLSSGSCSVTYSDTAIGFYTINASYGGDANNSPSWNTFTLQVIANNAPPRIPNGVEPSVIHLDTLGGTQITGYKVGSISPDFVVYNIPSINQTLLTEDIAQGVFTLLPNAVSTCSTQVQGQTYVMVSGFSDVWWGGSSTNSTEFVFGNYQLYMTSPSGWPAEPACSG